jgi:glyoxylase-like metal-dependent hydrolase (beta-lactamase superfamily II)
MSLLVSSNGERAVIVGDAIHVPPQITEPDWSPRPDVDPIRSKETRHALVDQAEQDGALLAAGHFPSPGFGRVVRLEGRRYWQGL